MKQDNLRKIIPIAVAASMTLSACSNTSANYAPAATTARYYEAAQASADAPDSEYNSEEYAKIAENSFKSTASAPLSTFSADVDTASYSNLRRMINEGRKKDSIPSDSVRIEEMINYFHYDYPAPSGSDPFSVTTEIADCPWNEDTKLMMIGVKAKDIDMQQRKPMNLVFLIDVSGSMYSDDKLPLVQKSFGMLTEELDENDRVSIVTYAGADKVELEGAAGNEHMRIREAIESLDAGGSTAGAAGITTAYNIAEKYFIEGGNNRIILATDGDLNVGPSSDAELKSLVESKRDKGVFLSVLGFGTGNIKDSKMETLADNGNGNYAYIDSEMEAKRVLVNEMGGTLETVAKDVKFQVEFNPAYIKGYRLIGYENRLLSAQDFDDDSKDAGEIGAGHTVTVLYEIADMNSKMEFDSADTDNNAQGTDNGSYCTVSVRYKEPDGTQSSLQSFPVSKDAYSQQMSDDMRFASAVASFGMILRDSEYKGTSDKSLVLGLISENYTANDQYKQEFVEMVKKALD